MIRINLLPEDIRGRSQKKAPSAPREGVSPIIALMIVVLLLVAGVAYYYAWSRGESAKSQTARLQAERDQLLEQRQQQFPEYQTLKRTQQVLANKLDILETLNPENGVLWSAKLNMLAYLVHPDVFLTNLRLSETINQVETQASIERRQEWQRRKDAGEEVGEQPGIERVPVITQTFTITGITTGEDSREQLDNYLLFLEDLKNYETENAQGQTVQFYDGFRKDSDLEMEGALDFRTEVGGREVGQFSISLSHTTTRSRPAQQPAG